jgi:hypothetical protein
MSKTQTPHLDFFQSAIVARKDRSIVVLGDTTGSY